MSPSTSTLLSLALLVSLGCAQAADAPTRAKPAQRPDATAPVAQPETDPAVSSSGALVPGQPIRPENTEEASVPKTPMDKSAATSADVGAGKSNDKTQRPAAGGDGSTSPAR